MYNPDAILRYAHDGEAYLVREAQACGVPQVEPKRLTLNPAAPIVVLSVTILLAVVKLFIF